MDGVIVDSEPHHERAFLDVFQELGYGHSHGIHFPDYIGRADLSVWHDFIAKHTPSQPLDELATMKQDRFIAAMRAAQPIFDGLPELVQKLAAHVPLAVASGSQHPVIEEVLSMKGLRPFFSAIVSSTDVKHGKPAPDIFLRAAELLGVAPADCCAIEDSKPGIVAGIAAGMRVVAITNTYPAAELRQATHVVRTYGEIEKLLLDRVKTLKRGTVEQSDRDDSPSDSTL
jgi:HAD superfamily hydrolase (TIGR01509 family)